MRLLADENVPGVAVRAPREAGHDVAWIREEAPGSSDASILSRSALETRVLLTLDTGFGELVFRAGVDVSSGVVLVRALLAPEALARWLVKTLEARPDWAGHFSVVDSGRVRMRPLPKARP